MAIPTTSALPSPVTSPTHTRGCASVLNQSRAGLMTEPERNVVSAANDAAGRRSGGQRDPDVSARAEAEDVRLAVAVDVGDEDALLLAPVEVGGRGEAGRPRPSAPR